MPTLNQIKTLQILDEKIEKLSKRIEKDMQTLENARARRENVIQSGALDPARLKKRIANIDAEKAELAKVIAGLTKDNGEEEL